jgi:AraC-like DNA-binding protein
MEDYNKIIESLGVRYIKSKTVGLIKPFFVDKYYDVENILILVNKGEMYFGENFEKLETDELLFLPAGKSVNLVYGPKNNNKVSKDEYISNRDRFFFNLNPNSEDLPDNYFTYISFDAKVFDSVNFFTSLDIPPFKINGCEHIKFILTQIAKEEAEKKVGKERIIKIYTEQIVIEIVRYILDKRLFVEQLATNCTYFKDPRLIDIFTYIKNNLAGDLSNSVLAKVANVSEDYVGQYFKMLTGINPQDYIEYQRMEAAVNLLRTTKDSIREISRQVGYKDTAYFCRRFKMMFGIPAGKMRRRESLINI